MKLYFYVVLLFLAIVYFAFPWDTIKETQTRMQKQQQILQEALK